MFGLRRTDLLRTLLPASLLAALGLACAEEPKPPTEPPPLYEQRFTDAQIGEVPDDLMVLGGEFRVEEVAGNKVLALPGEPIEASGLLFGPAAAADLCVTARIRGEGRGRRQPRFGVGLNGVSGFRLEIAPARKELELTRGGEVVTRGAFIWRSGAWTCFRLQLRRVAGAGGSGGGGAGVIVEGKAWVEGEPEPAAWTITYAPDAPPPAGRPWIGGSPYAELPLHFDDLVVRRLSGG
ncbi:MAG: hypothetical protein HZA54_01510 [Planctomycetes bacterium]|nr:hypothetical protein [Planctomycetota bacterium]